MSKTNRPRIAVFASGSGTTFQAVADAIHEGLVDFEIALLITDREDAGVLQKVTETNKRPGFGIKIEIINKKRFPGGAQGRGQTLSEAEATIKALQNYKIDHLALMGCMRIIAPQVIAAYGWQQEYAAQDSEYQGLYLARMSNT